MSSSDMGVVTVVGSGLIGRSWAMVFVGGGYKVKIYDNQPGQAAKAITEIRKQLEELEEAHMLRGELTPTQQLALLSSSDNLAQALEGAFFVQECVFEQPEVKQNVFQDIERLVGKDVILSSSTSCLVPSIVFSKVQNKSRCLVSHPVNPPYYVKLVELVPHPETAATVMDTTHAFMTKVGQAPVCLRKEIDGFALNRVQAAIIAESWRLVQVSVPVVSGGGLVSVLPVNQLRFFNVRPIIALVNNMAQACNNSTCSHKGLKIQLNYRVWTSGVLGAAGRPDDPKQQSSTGRRVDGLSRTDTNEQF